ncbi:MAG: single-stranded DNA-binding protein [Clostridia bacterium]|nr:single-stranded DNA-binding protein [Clostridia bacterium]
MASFNKVILIGNMVADPELKQTQGGLSVTSFSIAVNRRFKSENGQQECDFIPVVAWRQQAEFVCKYFKKGQPILICGQIQIRSWTNNNNEKRYTTEVVADEVSFVAPASNEQKPATPPNPANFQNGNMPSAYSGVNNPQFEEIPNDGDLPF